MNARKTCLLITTLVLFTLLSTGCAQLVYLIEDLYHFGTGESIKNEYLNVSSDSYPDVEKVLLERESHLMFYVDKDTLRARHSVHELWKILDLSESQRMPVVLSYGPFEKPIIKQISKLGGDSEAFSHGFSLKHVPEESRTSSSPNFGVLVGQSASVFEDDYLVIHYVVKYPDARYMGPLYLARDNPAIQSTMDVETYPGIKIRHELSHPFSGEFKAQKSSVGKNDAIRFELSGWPGVSDDRYLPELKEIYPYVFISAEQYPTDKVSDKVSGFAGAFTSWDDIGNAYLAELGHVGELPPHYLNMIKRFKEESSTKKEIVKKIFHHVQDNYIYFSDTKGLTGYQPNQTLSTIDNKAGNCQDLSSLIIRMMAAADLTAHPVLVMSGTHNSVHEDLPSHLNFNHVFVVWENDGDTLYLDAVSQVCGFGQVLSGSEGHRGLLLEPDAIRFIDIPENTLYSNIKHYSVSLNVKFPKRVDVSMTTRLEGSFAVNTRHTILKAGYDTNEALDWIARRYQRFEAHDLKTSSENMRILDSALVVEQQFWSNSNISNMGEILVINPHVIMLGEIIPRLDERILPFKVNQSEETSYIATLPIPEGYEVETLPEPAQVDLEGVSFGSTYRRDGNQIESVWLMSIQRNTFPQDAFPDLEDLRAQLQKEQNKKIILRKL